MKNLQGPAKYLKSARKSSRTDPLKSAPAKTILASRDPVALDFLGRQTRPFAGDKESRRKRHSLCLIQ